MNGIIATACALVLVVLLHRIGVPRSRRLDVVERIREWDGR